MVIERIFKPVAKALSFSSRDEEALQEARSTSAREKSRKLAILWETRRLIKGGGLLQEERKSLLQEIDFLMEIYKDPAMNVAISQIHGPVYEELRKSFKLLDSYMTSALLTAPEAQSILELGLHDVKQVRKLFTENVSKTRFSKRRMLREFRQTKLLLHQLDLDLKRVMKEL